MTAWIHINEQLPVTDMPVLVWFENCCQIAERWYKYDIDNMRDSFEWHIMHNYEDTSEIKYWSLLPNPPGDSK